MGVQVFWPPLTMLALFMGIVIMLMLRYGSEWCRLRHTTLDKTNKEWEDDDEHAAYEQRVSYA